ncbi:calcium uptake protein 1, mitochondrial-like [Montipora foliosa]|uniref:calcium uptake protein 1, mitochondrial-like n=1 Tax=Montipora foliosa TaxID=591990 RepID=UPI0035F1E301
MSRGAVFRRFVTESMTIYNDYHGSILSWWLRFCVRSARFASVNAGNHTEGQDFDREAFNRRQKRLVAAIIGSSVGLIGSSYCLYQKLSKAKADSPHPSIDDDGMNSIDKTNDEHEEQSDVEADGRKKKGKKGFRERRIIEYENRIRQYSTPDKVFRYFASLKVVHIGEVNEVFMTPEDFVRSLTPGKIQPAGLGLDEHERFNPEKHKYQGLVSEQLGQDSVFLKMGEYGLISFSDYIFLLTVLSLPPRMFEIAFQMFDLNGDGEVSPEEFEKVQNILFNMTSTGHRHRDHAVTGSVLSAHVNSGLKEYFFGKNMEKRLTTKGFMDFQRRLQQEVMFLEFNSYDPVDGRIREWEFADMLLTYSSFHEKKKQKILRKVKKFFQEDSQGIAFQDYLDFFRFMRNISEADMALSFHHAAGKAIDPETFKQVAKTVTDVDLTDNVVDVVYKMFDENDDGVLSHKEFVVVMKNQLVRGLENPRDTGFGRLMQAIWHCGKRVTYQTLHLCPRNSVAMDD